MRRTNSSGQLPSPSYSNANSSNTTYIEKFRSGTNSNRPDFNRAGSRDNVRKIVEKEGKIARNLVAWSVPSVTGSKNSQKNGERSVRHNKTQHEIPKQRGRTKTKKKTGNSSTKTLENQETPSQSKNPDLEQNEATNDFLNNETKCRETKSEEYQERIRKVIETSSQGTIAIQRPSSASSVSSQKNLRARYWSYLFDNFHRAVDEIYATCENDESIIECKEVIMMLDVCKKDFKGLIHRLELFNKLETSQVRPQCLAWEVRKQMSPGKCMSPNLRRSPSPAAVKFLNFGSPAKTAPFSWADRVRGTVSTSMPHDKMELTIQTSIEEHKAGYPSPVLEVALEENLQKDSTNKNADNDDDDNDGWELVTNNRSRSKTSNVSVSSTSSNQSFKKNFAPNHAANEVTMPTSVADQSHPTADVIHSNTDSKTMTSTIQEDDKEFSKYEESADMNMKSADSLGDATLDFSYDFTEDEIQLQIKEEQEKALASAIAEEETLTKELEEEALKVDEQDDDISSDRDYITVEDGRETPKDLSEELPLDSSMDEPDRVLTWEEMCSQYDNEHENNSTLNWGDMMEISESVRMPGRALEMHQKLSSPSRKKCRSESVKRSEERMARAERRRLRLLEDKCERLKTLSEKVRNVRELKNNLIQDKERTMLDQMKRVEVNRKMMIQEKIKKAQEEEMKVNEIAFINSLEAQNKKIEVQEKHQESEARLQDIMEERQRRKEDKQAKEEAAQERRKALERERVARLQEIKQKRGDQAEKWQKERLEREKTREEQAKERQKERKLKVAKRDEALQHATEELQKRIEQKHMESTRRHEQRIEEVKEKSRASCSSRHATIEETPSSMPYEKLKKCTLCDVEIASDVYMVSHLKGSKHRNAIKDINKRITDAEMEAFSSKYMKDVDFHNPKKQKELEDRVRAMKKRAKKIKARMVSKGKEYEANIEWNSKIAESVKKGKFQKLIKEISKILQAHSNGPWPANKTASLDKALSEIMRSLDGQNVNDQRVFCQLGGLAVLSKVLLLWDTSNIEKPQKNMVVPPKIIKHTCEVLLSTCQGCVENCNYFLLSNKLGILVDLLAYRLKVVEGSHTRQSSSENSSSQVTEVSNSSTTPVIQDNNIPGNLSRDEKVLSLISTIQLDDNLTLILMSAITVILKSLYPKWPIAKDKNSTIQDLPRRLLDLISYAVCNCIPDKLIKIYSDIQGPLEDVSCSMVVKSIIEFFQPLAFCVIRLDSLFGQKKDELCLISQTMQQTEAFGLVALTYSLLHQGSSMRISPSPLPFADFTVLLLISAMKTLNCLALVDLYSFQSIIGSEGVSLQYRSVVSYLLRYTTSNEKCDDLLHEVIISIGFFMLLNTENQVFIQSGRGPSLIQQLCTLPFGYFSDPRLKKILFPTLIAASYKNSENRELIAQDVNPTLLAIFLEESSIEKLEMSASIDSINQRACLDLRVPRKLWDDIRKYFAEAKS